MKNMKKHAKNEIPLKVFDAVFSHTVVYVAHDLNEVALVLSSTVNLESWEELFGYCYESIPRPALKPVHRAAWYKAGELQGTTSKLFSNL